MVLQGLQRYHPPLADLVAELELELGHPCQANAYLTPAGAQGFAVHSDSHDVFVFQTHGTKQWEVHGTDGPGDAVLLEPGVVAYLPTGTPHAARAQQTASLHVTIGINQLTWRALVERVVRDAVRQVARRPPARRVARRAGRPVRGLRDRLRGVADRLAAVDTDDRRRRRGAALPHQQAARSARRTAGPGGAGRRDRSRLAPRAPRRACPAGWSTSRRPGPGAARRPVAGGPRPPPPALEEVARREALTPRDLVAHLDLESALVLTRRLVREGLLRVG